MAELNISISSYNDTNSAKISLVNLHLSHSEWRLTDVGITITSCNFSASNFTMESNKNNNLSANVNASYIGHVNFKEVMQVVMTNCIVDGKERLKNTAVEFFGTTARITSTLFNENQLQSSLIVVNHGSRVTIDKSKFILNKVINGTIFVDNRSSLTIQKCNFFHNQASENGGCVLLQGFCWLHIDKTTFYNNTAENYGGAIMSQNNTFIEIGGETVFDSNKVFGPDSSGGAISNFNNVTLIASDSIFRNHLSVNQGGAVSAMQSSSILLSNASFLNNKALGSSGALQCYYKCIMKVDNCTFKDNVANDGGGIECVNATVEFDNCKFENNTSLILDTGAINMVTNSTIKVRNCLFHKNTAGRYGPAMQVFSSVDVEIEDSNFTDNVALYGAGAIYAERDIILRIKGSYFINNTASRGGGVMIGGITAYLNVTDSYFIDNHCITGAGGAIDYFGRIFMENSHFINNRAGYRGGAIGKLFTTSTDIHLKDCTFLNNSAQLDGGAIFCVECTVTSIRSNYTSNYATNDGGGVFVVTKSHIEIEDGTFEGNYAQYGNGGAVKLDDQSTVNINGSRFIKNSGVYGGGGLYLYASENKMVRNQLNNVHFEMNHVHFMGAAIYVGPWVKITAKNCSFVSNNADTYGGAIKMDESTESCFENCFFINNTGKTQAGAIYVKQQELGKPKTQLKLANCYFIDNQSKRATAIYVFSDTIHPSPALKTLNTIFSNGAFFYLNTSDANFTHEAAELSIVMSDPDPVLDLTETPYASGIHLWVYFYQINISDSTFITYFTILTYLLHIFRS